LPKLPQTFLRTLKIQRTESFPFPRLLNTSQRGDFHSAPLELILNVILKLQRREGHLGGQLSYDPFR
ncbi:MAG: hypothetical protein WA476_18230, partial [Acidobacteriaceae bacterium]